MKKTFEIDIDLAAENEIKKLKKKVRSLDIRLEKRDKEINQFHKEMIITKERRDKISDLCEQLVEELRDANWADIDSYE